MTTLSSIAEVLQSLARRNKLHVKIALGMLVILGLFEVRRRPALRGLPAGGGAAFSPRFRGDTVARMTRNLVISDGLVAGNPTDKYGARNPVVRRLMAGFDRGLFELLGQLREVSSVYEVGCGEGHVTARLQQCFPGARVVGSDVSTAIVEIAQREHPGLEFEVRSVYDIERTGRWDLVVACTSTSRSARSRPWPASRDAGSW